MLIDAHVHIFPNVDGYGPKGHTHGAGYGRIDAGDGIAQDVLPAINENTSHTLQMLLHEMRQAQVDKAVLILCPCYGDWSEYVLQACRDYPEQFTASAFFDPWSPAARQYYAEKLEGSLWKNIKIEFSEAGGLYGVYPGVQLDAPELRWLWEAMEAGGKTVSFDLGRPGDGSYQTDQIASIAKRHPGLKIVLCHMGQPSRAAERNPELWSAWLEQIRLGTLPNVWFDLSSRIMCRRKKNIHFPVRNAILTWHAGSWEQRNCYGGQIFHGCWGRQTISSWWHTENSFCPTVRRKSER